MKERMSIGQCCGGSEERPGGQGSGKASRRESMKGLTAAGIYWSIGYRAAGLLGLSGVHRPPGVELLGEDDAEEERAKGQAGKNVRRGAKWRRWGAHGFYSSLAWAKPLPSPRDILGALGIRLHGSTRRLDPFPPHPFDRTRVAPHSFLSTVLLFYCSYPTGNQPARRPGAQRTTHEQRTTANSQQPTANIEPTPPQPTNPANEPTKQLAISLDLSPSLSLPRIPLLAHPTPSHHYGQKKD